MVERKDGGGFDEEKIQAVVIADSFNRRFTPITQEIPRALIPLGNKVLLSYTIEYLVEAGVQEIILFCCSKGQMIRDYVNEYWKSSKDFKITCVLSSNTDCISLGDALREIDREGLIRSDFLLVPGDLISNISIANILEQHKIRRKKEKNLVMTLLYRELSPHHFSRCKEDDAFIAIDSESKQIVQYQKSHACRGFALSTSTLANGKDISVHYDLSFTHVAVCSPQVAPLFTDNFDYQTLDDFMKGVLINEDIMGDKINVSILKSGYSTRISDLHMYNAVSLDLLSRWIYPLVPETLICPYKRNNLYIHDDVRVEKDCLIKEDVLIGPGTHIDEGCLISQSVIGSNCKIGKGVIITNSYIWDNTIIEDECSITQTILCSNCHLKRNVKVIDSIISYNVCIDENIALKPCTRLSLVRPDSFDGDLEDNMERMDINEGFDKEVVGPAGKGYLWPFDIEEEGVIPSLAGNDYESSEGESSEDEDEESLPPSPPQELNNLHQFHIEVVENLRSGMLENIAADNIALEINASKFKFNISIPELCQTVMKGVLELSIKPESSKSEAIKDLDKVIKSLHSLLLKYFNSSEMQMYAIKTLEEHFLSMENTTLYSVLPSCLHKLYDSDILDESIILKWYSTPYSGDQIFNEDKKTELRDNPNLSKFMNWLQEAEEESDEAIDLR